MDPQDLRYVLTVVAAYLAPSSPFTWGKLVELLRVKCPGLRYSDIHPILFNLQAVPVEQDHEDPLMRAPYYDCEAAATEIRGMIERGELP